MSTLWCVECIWSGDQSNNEYVMLCRVHLIWGLRPRGFLAPKAHLVWKKLFFQWPWLLAIICTILRRSGSAWNCLCYICHLWVEISHRGGETRRRAWSRDMIVCHSVGKDQRSNKWKMPLFGGHLGRLLGYLNLPKGGIITSTRNIIGTPHR